MPLKYIEAYQPDIKPLNIGLVDELLQRKQKRYDTATALQEQTLQEIANRGYVDEQAREDYLNRSREAFTKVAKENRGDLSKGYDQILGAITNVRTDPYIQANQAHLEALKQQQAIATQLGSNAYIQNDIGSMSLIDPETGKYRTRFQPNVYDLREFDKIGALAGQGYAKSTMRQRKSSLPGMFDIVQGFETPEEATNFVTSNPDYITNLMAQQGIDPTNEVMRRRVEQNFINSSIGGVKQVQDQSLDLELKRLNIADKKLDIADKKIKSAKSKKPGKPTPTIASNILGVAKNVFKSDGGIIENYNDYFDEKGNYKFESSGYKAKSLKYAFQTNQEYKEITHNAIKQLVEKTRQEFPEFKNMTPKQTLDFAKSFYDNLGDFNERRFDIKTSTINEMTDKLIKDKEVYSRDIKMIDRDGEITTFNKGDVTKGLENVTLAGIVLDPVGNNGEGRAYYSGILGEGNNAVEVRIDMGNDINQVVKPALTAIQQGLSGKRTYISDPYIDGNVKSVIVVKNEVDTSSGAAKPITKYVSVPVSTLQNYKNKYGKDDKEIVNKIFEDASKQENVIMDTEGLQRQAVLNLDNKFQNIDIVKKVNE